jgi:hypothetical protein
VVVGWRRWVAWREGRGAEVIVEPARVLVVASVGLLAVLPFFTDRLMGGTDARWYAFMLGDFIEQLRAGVFPVFIGQGEFAWNGGVHPFRSAPVYMHVGGLWDCLTCRGLNVLALQHLTVLTAALAGSLGFYAAAVALLPRLRWTAAGVAMLYVTAPAWLGVLNCSDAYMTFMVLGLLPAVLYGNARTLLNEDGRGYGWLATGLSLVWMCHPPVAMGCTLATLLLQGGSFLLGRVDALRWRRAGRGAALFVGLSAYYFYSMSELPKAPGATRTDLLQMAALALTLTGLCYGVLRRRSGWWLGLIPPGLGLAWIGREPWFWWLAATTALVTVAAFILRRWRPGSLERQSCLILVIGLLVSAAAVQRWVGSDRPGSNSAELAVLYANRAHAWEYFQPVTATLANEANFQPGLGLWLGLLLPLLTLAGARPTGAKLFFAITALWAVMLIPIPWVSDFVVGYAPPELVKIASLPMQIRLTPVLAGLLAMSGVVWLATAKGEGGKGRSRWLPVGLALAVGWNLWQCAPFLRRGWGMIDSRANTADKLLVENRGLAAFTYHLLPEPEYFSHGRTDPWLQARLLNAGQRVVIGPDETAREMERNGRRDVRLTARTDPTSAAWLQIEPGLTVEPGERLLLRFEFDPTTNYSGYLIWSGERSYREYILPDSGQPLAFGTGPLASRVISVENTGARTERYKFSMPRGAGNSLTGKGDFFADVAISHFEPAKAPLRIDSLLPYRVTATVAEAGWMETSRLWLPGYRARLDGVRVEVRSSKQGLAMVAVSPGFHALALDYVGTVKLWLALVVSGLTWLGWLGYCGRRWVMDRG